MGSERTSCRREFLRNCFAQALVLTSGGAADALIGAEKTGEPSISRVSIASDALLRGAATQQGQAGTRKPGGNVDSARVLALLDHAVGGLASSGDPASAWARVARPEQQVAIKVNTLGGRGLSSNVVLVEAICERLQTAGIRAQDIVVWDRSTEELERAGFRIRTGGNAVQCYGTDRVGYEEELVSYGSVGSQLSRILTRHCDVLINVPVLKDHDGAGVSIALKNMYGVIHNPNKYHPNGCDPYVADVNMLAEIRSKLRLHICDATAACFEGGPAFKPEFTWQPNALMVAEDPVALDQVGWETVERKRAEEGLKTIAADGRAPRYIATAADKDHRLGTDDRKRIRIVETRVA